MITSDKISFYFPVIYLVVTLIITFDNSLKYHREQSFPYQIATRVTNVKLMITSNNFMDPPWDLREC